MKVIGGMHYENLNMQYTGIFKVVEIKILIRIFFHIFLIFAQNIDCECTLEPPHRGGSDVYPQSMFWIKTKKRGYTPLHPSFTIKSGV